ncbi:Crp/Fnr family transcriptional regulator [Candidatus Nomurabacteria bacterium]|nr:Crp/Fnr family transcriptional regulator [Candidatus Nomurabacteria bacterium]
MNRVAKSLSNKLWNQYLGRARILRFKKSESIIMQGDELENIYIIKSGVVRVYDITAEGEERTVALDIEGEIFPIGLALGMIQKSQYFYQAQTDCEVYSIRKLDFLRYLRFHPKIAMSFYKDLAEDFVGLQSRILALEQTKASSKILLTLSYLAERFGKQVGSNTTEIQIPLTQQEIANFIGLTRETTSTELKKLETSKIIRCTKKHYSLNQSKLQDAINQI